MTVDTDMTERLRAALDEQLGVAFHRPPGRGPAGPAPVATGARGRGGRSRLVPSLAVVVVVALALGAGISFGPRSRTRPSPVAARHHPRRATAAVRPGWIALPRLLPAGATGARVATGPVPVPSTGTYAQAYRGPAAIDPAELLITTVMARPGALAAYAGPGQSVPVPGGSGYLVGHQILWETADSVVVSLESSGLSSSDLEAAAQVVEPHPAVRLGVDLRGSLPDGLTETGQGYVGGDTVQYQGDEIFFAHDSCEASTEVWAGTPADFGAVAIIATHVQTTTVGKATALLAQIDPTTWALLWSPAPGIDVRLQGSNCDLTGVGADLKVADAATWTATLRSLGSKVFYFTPRAPVGAVPDNAKTFGLAH
jgi:hypothetical protein